MHERMGNIQRILVIEPEGKRAPGGPHRRWKDIIKLGFKKIVFYSIA
jgi:hypothetical protein